MKIYAGYGTPPQLKGLVRDLRAVWALEEIGADYEIHWLNLIEGEQRTDAARKIHPFGKVPAMVDGDLTLFESGAICQYIANKHGALGGPATSPQWPEVTQWCFAALDTVAPRLFDHFIWQNFRTDNPICAEVSKDAKEVAQLRFDVLEGVLESKDFLVGDEFTIADILMASAIRNAMFPDIIGDHPNIRRYLDSIFARPAFQRAFELNIKGPAEAA